MGIQTTRWILSGILLFALIALSACGGRTPTPTPTSTVTKPDIPTVLYQNTRFGFTINVPRDWKAGEGQPGRATRYWWSSPQTWVERNLPEAIISVIVNENPAYDVTKYIDAVLRAQVSYKVAKRMKISNGEYIELTTQEIGGEKRQGVIVVVLVDNKLYSVEATSIQDVYPQYAGILQFSAQSFQAGKD